MGNVKRDTCLVCRTALSPTDWHYCKPCRKAKRQQAGPKVYKVCQKCGSDNKTPTDFYCRACRAAWNRNHPRPYRPNPAGSRRRYLKRLYGLTEAEYTEKERGQSGLCAICGEKPERNLDVDHNHETGQVRGLLCNQCNQALGLFKESPHLLEIAGEYLRRWN